MEFLQNFRLDRNSFWAGFLAASLFWWLVRIARPLLSRLRQSFRTQAEQVQGDTRAIVEIRLRNETLRYAQSRHLAAPLFSLDEIILPPRLLASGAPPDSLDNLPSQDIAEVLIPDTPDWPQIASFYNWPTLSLEEALSADANLAVIAQPGSGKSIALAYLASQLARQEITIPLIDSPVPIYTHANDLVLPATSPDTLSAPLTGALANYISQQTFARLPAFLDRILQQGRALLILDGLDELNPANFDLVADYLEELLQSYPGLRIVAAISTDYWGKLPQIGFHILPLANWNQQHREQYLEKWAVLWKQHFSSPADSTQLPDPDLIKGWLIAAGANLSPLEFTCKTWAAFAGDSLGANAIDAIESCLRRQLHNLPEKKRRALEHVAAQMLLTQQPVVDKETIERWLGGRDEFKDLLDDETLEELGVGSSGKVSSAAGVRVRSSSAMTAFIECGILRSHPGERYSLSHPVWTGYLAARSLEAPIGLQALDAHKHWDAKNLAMLFLSGSASANDWIVRRLQKSDDFLLPRFLLQASRWLPYTNKETQWTQAVLRALASEVHNPAWPVNIKARLIAALIASGNPGVAVLLRQLLRAPERDTRRLAILGLGMLRDAKAVEDLEKLLMDEDPQLASASTLSLAAIGSKPALEAIAAILLHGNEHQKRSAAEAFANHAEEGHPALKDASKMEDPAIRRAAVYGLARVNQPWADEIIVSLRTTDTQWVVQDAANQVMDLRTMQNPRVPARLPELNQAKWLIEFAASRGLGIAPGQPAIDMLFTALEMGDRKQKLAALYTLARRADIARKPQLENSFHSPEEEIRQAVLETIWRLQSCDLDFK